jgi:hypothetical protein
MLSNCSQSGANCSNAKKESGRLSRKFFVYLVELRGFEPLAS